MASIILKIGHLKQDVPQVFLESISNQNNVSEINNSNLVLDLALGVLITLALVIYIRAMIYLVTKRISKGLDDSIESMIMLIIRVFKFIGICALSGLLLPLIISGIIYLATGHKS